MKSHLQLTVLFICLAIIVAACGDAPTATPTAAPKAPATATTAPKAQPIAAPAAPTSAPTAAASTATAAPAPSATKPAAAPTATQAAAQAPAGNTPDVIANAQRAVLKLKSYRVRIAVVNDKGVTTNMVTEYVLPDRVHMTIGGSETIVIKNGGFWQKAAGGQWQALPAAQAASDAVFAALDPNQIDAMMQDIVIDKFKSLGVEMLDGKPMRTYEYITSTAVGSETIEGTNKIWIGVADGLPYKSEGTSTAPAALGGKSQTSSMYEYDNNIKIEAPM